MAAQRGTGRADAGDTADQPPGSAAGAGAGADRGAPKVAANAGAGVAVGQPPRRDGRPPEVAPLFEQPGVLTPKGKYVLEPSLQFGYSTGGRLHLGAAVVPEQTHTALRNTG